MPTVIDELIVKLKLDNREFKAGTTSSKKEAKTTAHDLRKSGRDAGQFFTGIRNEALKLFGVFATAGAVTSFAKDALNTSSTLSRMAANLGTSASELKSWGNAVEVAGGSSEGFQSTVKNLSRSMTEFQIHGTTGILPYLRALHVEIIDAKGQLLPFDKILSNIGEGLKKYGGTRANAANIASAMGIDEGTFNLLMKSDAALNKLLETEKKRAAGMDEFGAKAEKLRASFTSLQQAWESASISILSKLVPALQAGTDALQESTDSGIIDALGKGWRFLTAEITGDSKEIAAAAEDLRKSLEKLLTFDFSPSGWFSGVSDWIKDRKEAISSAIGIKPDPEKPAAKPESGVSQAILDAQIQTESGGNPKAMNWDDVKRTGSPSMGLAQFQPATAKQYGIDPMDPEQAKKGQRAYMGDLFKQFGSTQKALAAYNWGPGNLQKTIDKHGNDWMAHIPKGTQDYVKKIESKANNVSVGHVTINTQATDAKGIARDFVSNVVTQADGGMR